MDAPTSGSPADQRASNSNSASTSSIASAKSRTSPAYNLLDGWDCLCMNRLLILDSREPFNAVARVARRLDPGVICLSGFTIGDALFPADHRERLNDLAGDHRHGLEELLAIALAIIECPLTK